MIVIDDLLRYLDLNNIEYCFKGNQHIQISQYSFPGEIKNNSLLWIKTKEFLWALDETDLKDVLLIANSNLELDGEKLNLLTVENSKQIFFVLIKNFFTNDSKLTSISKNSIIDSNKIGLNVSIGNNCYIGAEVEVGDNTIIDHNVILEGKVIIGDDCKIKAGAIIGSEGFGFYEGFDGNNMRIPHLGGVIIGKQVEIGANTCIDRGTLGNTVIGDYVKIDNLSQIAHNVIIGEKTMILSQTSIAGSSVIGKSSYIAPNAVIKNQIKIGNNCMVGMGVVISKNIPDGYVVAGNPPKKYKVDYKDIINY